MYSYFERVSGYQVHEERQKEIVSLTSAHHSRETNKPACQLEDRKFGSHYVSQDKEPTRRNKYHKKAHQLIGRSGSRVHRVTQGEREKTKR